MCGALGLAPINNTGISAFIVLRSALLRKFISDTSTVSGSPSFILCVSLLSLDMYTATVDVKKLVYVAAWGCVGLRARDSRIIIEPLL